LGLKKKGGSAIFYLEKTKNTTPNFGIKIKGRALRYFLFREDQKNNAFFCDIKREMCVPVFCPKKKTPIFVMKKATGALRFFFFRQGQQYNAHFLD
jgi:hypothetical protein